MRQTFELNDKYLSIKGYWLFRSLYKRANVRSIAVFNGELAYKFLWLSKSLKFIYKINKLSDIFVFYLIALRRGLADPGGRAV
jgi:hypothetical protein